MNGESFTTTSTLALDGDSEDSHQRDREPGPPLTQIAFSVVDLAASERWFREGLGFWPAGGSRLLMRGPVASAVQGLPRVASTCWWLVDRNPWFQLELFQFERPLARLMAEDLRPCDIGYTRMGVSVADFEGTLARLGQLGSFPLAEPTGPTGGRRACVRNPDGVYVEIMEDDPLPEAPVSPVRADCRVAVRSVTLSVRDIVRSEEFFSEGLGLRRSEAPLRVPEHEGLWGLPGAQSRSRAFTAGSVLVELVQYADPVGRPRPADYRISDQGILNIAFGARSRRGHAELYRRARAAGAQPNCRPVHLPGAGVVYVNDPQRFSVELLWMSARFDSRWGFTRRPLNVRPLTATHTVEHTIRIPAPASTAWAAIATHEEMGKWIGIGSVRRTVEGAPDPDGRGSERLLELGGVRTTEQVVTYDPPRLHRYRVTKGSPVVCHQGEIRLRAIGDETELTWQIRFRPRVPGTGRALASALSWTLRRMLRSGLKPHVETVSRRPLSPISAREQTPTTTPR